MRILVAGATGALGRALVPVLVGAGHQVWGTTRRSDRTERITASGATPLICDALDPASMTAALRTAAPDAVVHHLTALPYDWGKLRKGTADTDRLRRAGTRALVEACIQSGVRRIVAESVASLYAPGPGRATEDDAPWLDAPRSYAATVDAALDLERTVHRAGKPDSPAAVRSVVLRYGILYGPGTWWATDGDIVRRIRRRLLPVIGNGAGLTSFVHVDDAARATARALDPAATEGTYNIVDDDPVSYAELLPAVAAGLQAPPPRHVPTWLARLVAGPVGPAIMTRQRAADNRRAREVLGWVPGRPTWRGNLATEP